MSIVDYVPECCQFSLLPHIVLFGLLIGSVVPARFNKWWKYQVVSRIAFHKVSTFIISFECLTHFYVFLGLRRLVDPRSGLFVRPQGTLIIKHLKGSDIA
jgi:hypothetical protein